MSESKGARERIHFVSVEIRNHMRVRRAHVFLPGRGVVPVSGRNAAGKTSFKRSLAALVGGDGVVEEEPRTKDAPLDEESYIIGTLSDGTTLRRAFTGAASAPKGRFTARDAGNKDLKQHHLNAIVGPRAIEPMTFFDRSPSEQAEILMGHSPGLRETLDSLKAERERLEEARRPHNSQIQVLGRIPKPDGQRPERVDVSDAMLKLRKLQSRQRERSDLQRQADDVVTRLRRNHDAQRSMSDRIAEMEEALADARADLEAMREAGETLEEERLAAQEAVDDVPPVDVEIETVQTLISQADAVNAVLKPWERYDEAQEALAQHRRERDRFNEALIDVERQKRDALAAAELPFTDVSIGDDGQVLLGGVALSAASGMERCRLALEVAIADDPELGVVFMSGNELDDEALVEIHRMAEEQDFQVILDIIHSPGFAGEVRMADGVAHQAKEAAP